MRSKQKQLVLLCVGIVASLIVFSSCSALQDPTGSHTERVMEGEIAVVQQENILYTDLQAISDDQLAALLDKEPTIQQMQEAFDHLAFKKREAIYYTVVKTNSQLLLISFNPEGKYVSKKEIKFSNVSSKSQLEQIKVGDSLDHVMQADEFGDYNFLQASWSNFPQISYHFFEDGSCFEVCYQDRVITKIFQFSI